MRYSRYMRPMKDSAGPARILAVSVDVSPTSTVPGERTRVLHISGWSSHLRIGRSPHQMTSILSEGEDEKSFLPLLSSLLDEKGTTWIVSDNAVRDMALLDIWGLIERHIIYLSGDPVDAEGRKICEDSRNPSPTVILQNPPVIISLRRPGSQGAIKILDVQNWGFPRPDPALPSQERADIVASNLTAMCFALECRGWGGLSMTASGQADRIWRTCYMTHCPFLHANPDTLRLESQAIFGGRSECHRIGMVYGPLYQLDVSGMYSYLAGSQTLPVAFHTYYPNVGCDITSILASGLGAIARVTVETKEPAYPYRRNHDVVYPVGRFTTVLGGADLLHAVEHGRVVAWHEASTYTMSPFLQACMFGLYKGRQFFSDRGDSVAEKLCKRWANSLVGRMARRESRWVGYPNLPVVEPWGEYNLPCPDGTTRRVRVLDWHAEIEEDAGFADDAVPAANVWVTAAGRQLMWRLMQICGMEHVYYVYVDEIWTDEIGYERLSAAGQICPGQWGLLQLKGVYPWVVLDGINTYRTNQHTVCAGVPGSGSERLSAGYQYRVAESPLAAVKEGRTPEAIEIVYAYNPGDAYRHGRVTSDGRVLPWQMEE